MMPAMMYPSTTGCFNHLKIMVISPAEKSMTARSDISTGMSDIRLFYDPRYKVNFFGGIFYLFLKKGGVS